MFKYNLHDIVEIEVIGTSTQIVEPEAQSSGPKAKIVGRAEYVNAGPSYLLRYTGADNQPVEA